MTSAFSKSKTGSTNSPKAMRAPARALSRGTDPTGSTSPRDAAASTCWICAASVGEFTVSVRMRSPAPLLAACAGQRAADRGDEAAPRTDAAQFGDGLRAVGVVEGEDRRLREDVGAAAGGRMIGIAFDLGRAALVALDQQAGGDAAERHGGGEEQRLAGHDVLRLPHVRHDQLVGLARAAGDPGQRQRRAHQLQEAATADRVVPLRGVRRELAVEEVLELGRFGDALRGCASTAGRRRPAAWRGWQSRSSVSALIVLIPLPALAVAHRAVGQALDVVFGHQLRAQLLLGHGGLVAHREHLGARPHVLRRVAMAVETPLHLQ